MHTTSRRHFLKNAAILSPVLTFLPSYLTAGKGSRLRIGFIGTGLWGQQYLDQALQSKNVDVRAISDTDPKAIRQSLQLFSKAGYSRPDIYEDTYETLLSRKDIDAVIIATPWEQHYTIAKAAMLAGKHVACGAIMGATLEEHMDIVRISEQTGRQYFTLDEYSYRRDLLAVTNMAKEGVFGELTSIRAGARHDVLPAAHDDKATSYPVYPAAAAARMLGVKKGNTFVSLRVVKEKQQYVINKPRSEKGPARLVFTSGDVQTIELTTQQGQTLSLQMDAGQDRPASTGFQVTGSQGTWMDLINSIYLKDQSPANQIWEAGKPHIEQYAEDGDGYALALHEFVNSVQQPVKGELPVYAAAANSLIGPMATLSAQRGGATVQFPEFRNNPII
ncbi:Gfo/Idh/MocA family protein [Chitinophaga sp. S165]|uniref:Gfo/Idh/MocA family protein n=1 Tax=Chitinophaga sp. S165 TaxID=2135462 RepID=UPI000D718409|nr:Gfo/Idh/MocA family oxidoreductase [Chitinophaga sp. S165]PWV51416.1 putative dehydrogenase [Chitinophaga sp. S165]